MSTVPFIAPDGSVGEIPAERAHEALQAGGKLGINMTAPDGSTGIIPMDRVHEAIAQGGRLMGAGPPPAPVSSDLQTPTMEQVQAAPLDKMGAMEAQRLREGGKQYSQAAEMATPAGVGGRVATGAGPEAINLAKEVIPSAKRAGQALGEVEGIAGHLPVNTAKPMQIAQRAQELSTRGNQPVKVISDFLKRMNIGTEGPVVIKLPSSLTFQEARDFYSAAREMTMDEIKTLTPKMRAQVIQFANELGNSISQTAATVGQDARYGQALKEYRQAKTLGEAIDSLKRLGVQQAGYALKGTALGAGYKLGKELGWF